MEISVLACRFHSAGSHLPISPDIIQVINTERKYLLLAWRKVDIDESLEIRVWTILNEFCASDFLLSAKNTAYWVTGCICRRRGVKIQIWKIPGMVLVQILLLEKQENLDALEALHSPTANSEANWDAGH